eukprot:scaffold3725_cov114-Cylindrotheca_fusiformis.AAC.7
MIRIALAESNKRQIYSDAAAAALRARLRKESDTLHHTVHQIETGKLQSKDRNPAAFMLATYKASDEFNTKLMVDWSVSGTPTAITHYNS